MDRKSIPTTYSEARETLKGRESRTIANNTTLVELDGCVGLRLHSTYVVRCYPDGRISLHTGGYETVTTKDRLNRVGRAHGWNVYAEWRVWYVAHRSGPVFKFRDGFTIPPHAREPQRADHCTHPERDICDCDWCRVLRARPDVRVENHGTIFLVRPLGESALAWLSEHTDGRWFGDALAVEHRFVADLVSWLRDAGFRVAA